MTAFPLQRKENLEFKRGCEGAQPLEPIFFPKLQIYFADFPYIRCRIGQRLLTLDTCCGYEYGRRRNCTFTTIFKAPWLHTQRPRNAGALPTFGPSLLASRFVGPLWFCEVVKKKRELFWEQPRRSRRSLVLPLKLYPPSGAGILTCFPFACRATESAHLLGALTHGLGPPNP